MNLTTAITESVSRQANIPVNCVVGAQAAASDPSTDRQNEPPSTPSAVIAKKYRKRFVTIERIERKAANHTDMYLKKHKL